MTVAAFRPSESQQAVSVSTSTIYRWVKAGLPLHKVGNTSLILMRDFEAFIANNGSAKT